MTFQQKVDGFQRAIAMEEDLLAHARAYGHTHWIHEHGRMLEFLRDKLFALWSQKVATPV